MALEGGRRALADFQDTPLFGRSMFVPRRRALKKTKRTRKEATPGGAQHKMTCGSMRLKALQAGRTGTGGRECKCE